MHRFFKPPHFDDLERQFRARILNAYVWFSIALSPFVFLLVLMRPESSSRWTFLFIFLFATSIIMLVALKRRLVTLASWLAVVVLFLIGIVLSVTGGGIWSQSYPYFLLVVITAGLIISQRAALFITALGIISQMVMALLEVGGIMPQSMVRHSVESTLVNNVIYITLSAFLLYLFTIQNRLSLLKALEENRERKAAEESLARSNAELQGILDSSIRVSIITTDRMGRIGTFSRGAEAMLGYTAEEVVGLLTPLQFHDPGEVEARRAELSRELGRDIGDFETFVTMAQRGDTEERTWTYIRRDGMRLTVNLAVSAIHGDEGSITGYVGTAVDISARVRAEDERQAAMEELQATMEQLEETNQELVEAGQQLAVSEARYRTLFDTVADGIFVIGEDGRFTELNRAACDQLGYTREELTGMHVSSIAARPGFDIAPVIERVRTAGWVSYQTENRRKDGSIIPVELTLSFLALQGSRGLLGVARDITERKRAELALIESERTLSILIANLPGMAYRCVNDRDWTMQFISEGCRDLTGYAPEDLVGNSLMSYGRLIHEEDLDMVWQEVQAALQSRVPFQFQYRITTSSGAVKWVWERGCGIYDGAGAVIVIEGFIMDITERTQAEAALQRSEATIRSVFQNAPVGICIMHNRRYLSANRYWCESFGYREEDIIGLTTRMLYEDDAEYERVGRALYAGRREGGVASVETRLLRGDGSLSNVIVTMAPISPGEPDSDVVAIIHDITERKRAEIALRESEDKFRRVFETSRDLMYITGMDGGIIDVNPMAEIISGFSLEELKSMNILTLYAHPEERNALVRTILEQGFVEDYEVSGKKKDGSIIDVLVTSTIRRDNDGTVIGYQGSLKDITERKHIEVALAESEEKFKTLFESAGDAILILDREVFIDCNIMALRIFQCNRDEIIGRSPIQFSPPLQPDGRPTSEAALEKIDAAYAGSPQHFEWRHARLDGTLFDAEVTLNRILVQGTYLLQAIVRDVTQRKQAESELRRLEEQFKMVVDNFPDGIIVLHDHEYRYIFAEGSGLAEIGLSKEILLHKKPSELFPAEFSGTLEKHLGDAFTGVKKRFEIMLGADYFSETVLPLKMINGDIIAVMGVINNITERRRAEIKLGDHTRFIESLVNMTPDILYIYDLIEQKNIYSNDGIHKMLGYTLDEIQAMGDQLLPTLMHPDDFLNYVQTIIQKYESARDNEPIINEYRMKHKTGDWRWLVSNETIYLRQPAGTPWQIFGIVHEITERKHMEDQLRTSLREKEALLRELYHRTKNNMQVICGMLSLESGIAGRELLRPVFTEIESKIRTMALVHQKLYESRDLTSINLVDYVNDVTLLILGSSVATSGRITAEVTGEAVNLPIDSAIPLGLVVNELITNTVKHAFPGGTDGRITIVIRSTTGGVIMTYTDTGVGLPAGFTPGSTASLGMLVMHEIVRHQLQGSLRFIDGPGFTCEITVKTGLYENRL